jgi:hypothetical protein
MAKLGGEFRDPDPHRDLTVHRGRCAFLRALSSVAPETLDALRGAPLEAYLAARAATVTVVRTPRRGTRGGPVDFEQEPPWSVYRWEPREGRALWSELPTGFAEELVPLRDAVLAWGRTYALSDNWMLDVAMSTLQEVVFLGDSVTAFAAPQFMALVIRKPFEFRSWKLEWETWSEYEVAALEALREYRARCEAEAVKDGLKRSPVKNAPKGTKNVDMHFEWLVRWQVQEWTHKRIAIHYGRAVEGRMAIGVATAVRNTADLIGLTRRTS